MKPGRAGKVLVLVAVGSAAIGWTAILASRGLGLSSVSDLLGRWRPTIGDPTLGGWITVAAYAVAAGTCGICARRAGQHSRSSRRKRDEILWLGLSLILTFLCINKQLDLQSLLTEMGRVVARSQGWYRQRGIVQRWFLVIVTCGAVASLAVVVVLAWGRLRAYGAVLIGMLFLIVFVVIRAASFHHVDRLLGFRAAGLKLNWVFELLAIACVIAGGAQYLRRKGPMYRPRE